MSSRKCKRYVDAPIDKCGWYGLWIRHSLLKFILSGTSTSLILQNHRTRWRTRIMEFFSVLGTEACFTCIIPLLTWILDPRLGRLFALLLSIGFYTVGFVKCLLCLPRPPSPPVTPLHDENGDWAFPSNHATVALLVPWYLWIYSFQHYDWWPLSIRVLLFGVAMIWFSGVALSRLYLGVHSVADMVAGATLGVCILSVYLMVDDYIDYKCVAGDYVIPKTLTFFCILMYVHPRTNPETSSYGESVLLLGSSFGVVVSRRLTIGTYNHVSLLQMSELSGSVLLWRSLFRLALGTGMLIGCRTLLKPLLRRIIRRFYAYLGLPSYIYKDYIAQFPAATKHYTNAYRLPPLPNCTTKLLMESNLDEDEPGENSQLGGAKERKNFNGKASLRLKGAQKGRNVDTEKEIHETGIQNGTSTLTEGMEGGPLPYDVDIPTRFIVYSIMGWILGEGAPALFDLLNV